MTAAVGAPSDNLYEQLVEVAATLYKRALTDLPPDVRNAVNESLERERGSARRRIGVMVDAIETSDDTGIIVCQDTGICVCFVGIGTEFDVNGARLLTAIRDGIEVATKRHSLRSSIVHPLTRENLQTNTGPGVPVMHINFIDGADYIDILLMPKGSGSENMSFLKMLLPSEGIAGIKRFVLECVVSAGPNPCPPTVIGIGLGGTADRCAALAKLATLRPIGIRHEEPEIAALETQLLEAINVTGIGPQGLGGSTTAFDVHIEYAWTHISMNPVAVNVQCWRGERARATVHSDGSVDYGY